MMLTPAAVALVLLLAPNAGRGRKAPPPPPPPPPAAAVADQPTGAPAPSAIPQLPRPAKSPAIPVAPAPRTGWRVETVGVLAGTTRRMETRVVRANGAPVTVAQGLGAVGLEGRLADRARPKADVMAALTVGGVAVLVAGGAMAVVGVVAAVVGALLTPLVLLQINTAGGAVVSGVVREGPFILFAGVSGVAVGVTTVVVALVPLVLTLVRPPAVDQTLMTQLGSSLAWDPAEAAEVVSRFNASGQ